MTTTFKKAFQAILAIVMVAALLLGCVACKPADQGGDVTPGNKDNDKSKYEGLADDAYAQALTQDLLAGPVDALAGVVGAYADYAAMASSATNVGSTAELDLTLGDLVIDLLEQAVFGTADSGLDMSFLTNIGLNIEMDATTEMAQYSLALALSDTEIVKLLLLGNEETVYVGAPDLADKFLEVDLADMGVAANAATPAWMDGLVTAIPSEEKTAEILNRYLALGIEEFDKVERTTETLELDGLKQDATKLTIKIYEQDLLDAAKAILTAAKDDADIKTIVENYGKFYNEMMAETYAEYDMEWTDADLYTEFTTVVDEALKELPSKAETDEGYIGLILYVDGDHNVIGCSLDMGVIHSQSTQLPNVDSSSVVTASAGDAATPAPEPEYEQEAFIMFTYYTVTDGNNFKSLIEIPDAVKITGSGTTSNGTITGTYSVTAEDMTWATLELKDFVASEAAVIGTVTVKPTEDAIQYIFNGPIPVLNTTDVALEIKLDATNDTSEIELKLVGGGATIIGLALKAATKTPAAVQAPTNTTTLTGTESVYGLIEAMGVDFATVFAKLRTAGVPEMLVTALESLVPAV